MSTRLASVRAQWALASVVSSVVLAFGLTTPEEANVPASQQKPADSSTGKILLGEGAGLYPSERIADWVQFADHVIAVTVKTETPEPIADIDLERGEGIVFRNLKLVVDNSLWSSPGAPDLPGHLDWTAFGWSWKGDVSNREEMAAEGSPRLEVGHSYLIAIRHRSSVVCEQSAEDPTEGFGLGGSSVVPFDSGLVGEGEFEGSLDGLRGHAFSSDSVYGQAMGFSSASVQLLLRATARIVDPIRQKEC